MMRIPHHIGLNPTSTVIGWLVVTSVASIGVRARRSPGRVRRPFTGPGEIGSWHPGKQRTIADVSTDSIGCREHCLEQLVAMLKSRLERLEYPSSIDQVE